MGYKEIVKTIAGDYKGFMEIECDTQEELDEVLEGFDDQIMRTGFLTENQWELRGKILKSKEVKDEKS